MDQRQPGVDRHDRHLDRKANQKRAKHPQLQVAPLRCHRQRVAGEPGREGGDVKGEHARVGGVPEHDGQEAKKGQHAASKGVDEKLDGSPAAIVATPDADQEEQRHQGELEKHIEENDVASGKHAEHRCFQQQEQAIEADGLLLRGIPADEDRRHRQ